MMENINEQEIGQTRTNIKEKAILGKVAELLAGEKLINIDEEMRFLSCLREDDLSCH